MAVRIILIGVAMAAFGLALWALYRHLNSARPRTPEQKAEQLLSARALRNRRHAQRIAFYRLPTARRSKTSLSPRRRPRGKA